MNDWFGRECSMAGSIVCKKCEKSPIDCECGLIKCKNSIAVKFSSKIWCGKNWDIQESKKEQKNEKKAKIDNP